MAQLFNPLFIDVTCYGWTSQCRRKSLALAVALRERWPLCLPSHLGLLAPLDSVPRARGRTNETVMLHLTTLNLNRTSAAILMDEAVSKGLHNFLVLQGDQCGRSVRHVKEGFLHAIDLVRFLRDRYGDRICIGVGGDPTYRSSRSRKKEPLFPTEQAEAGGSDSNDTSDIAESSEHSGHEGEGEGGEQSIEEYMRYLKQKVDAGADFIVTQCVNDVESYVGFLRCPRRARALTHISHLPVC